MIRKPLDSEFEDIRKLYEQRNYKEEVLHYNDFSCYKDNIRVYIKDDKVIGFVLYYDMGGKWCFIDLLSIDKNYREQGIGFELIKSLEDQPQWHYVFTSVISDDDKAINFAEKCGFKYNNQLAHWMWRDNKSGTSPS